MVVESGRLGLCIFSLFIKLCSPRHVTRRASRPLYGAKDYTPMIVFLYLHISFVLFEAAESAAWPAGKLKDPGGGETFRPLDFQYLHRTVPSSSCDQEKFPALTWAGYLRYRGSTERQFYGDKFVTSTAQNRLPCSTVLFEAAESKAWTGGKLNDPGGGENWRRRKYFKHVVPWTNRVPNCTRRKQAKEKKTQKCPSGEEARDHKTHTRMPISQRRHTVHNHFYGPGWLY